MPKITTCAAKAKLQRKGVSFSEDFHALRGSKVQAIVEVAREAGYRKSKTASGSTGRMFFQRLARAKCGAKRKSKALSSCGCGG